MYRRPSLLYTPTEDDGSPSDQYYIALKINFTIFVLSFVFFDLFSSSWGKLVDWRKHTSDRKNVGEKVSILGGGKQMWKNKRGLSDGYKNPRLGETERSVFSRPLGPQHSYSLHSLLLLKLLRNPWDALLPITVAQLLTDIRLVAAKKNCLYLPHTPNAHPVGALHLVNKVASCFTFRKILTRSRPDSQFYPNRESEEYTLSIHH